MPLDRLLALVAPPLCLGCGGLAGRVEPLCGACRRRLRWLGAETAVVGGVELWAPVAYEEPARALVRGLKFRGATGSAATIAAQIAAGVPPDWLASATLVPVPLHPARLRRRGYNQAALVASALAARLDLPLVDCLERRGARTTQVGRGRTERLAGVAGSVRVRVPEQVPPTALLVDDVATTGATLAACAAALRDAGAPAVRAVAYARTPGR